jgi:hypothetical protein
MYTSSISVLVHNFRTRVRKCLCFIAEKLFPPPFGVINLVSPAKYGKEIAKLGKRFAKAMISWT